MMKEKVIVILGPTATGKSALGLWLAEQLATEIISGDSMLVYKEFDIGTAKPDKEELNRVKHHLVDILTPDTSYSAAAFQQEAAQIITKINDAGKIPLVVGGTGLYLKALLEGYEFPAVAEDSELRAELEQQAKTVGNEALYEKLCQLSPLIAEQIHPNNRKRLIRALEAALTGSGISRSKQEELVYDAFVIGLTAERQKIYQRIDERVEAMFAAGLVDEVKNLVSAGVSLELPAMQALGYKDVVAYLNGETNLATCKKLVAQHTRNFAKRQFTWYKKMPYVNWYDIYAYKQGETLSSIIWHDLVEWQKLE